MVLLPVTIITRRLLTNAWNSWGVVLVMVLIARVGAQDLEDTEANSGLPAQVLKGMDMSHGSYRLDAFDCDEPEDIVTQSIPKSCAVDAEENEDMEKESEDRQDYTILQKVPTFEYTATLCTLYRSRHYYDCVWASHVRIAGPAKVYWHETLRVDQCLTASMAMVYLDSESEINYLQSVVEGSITYNGAAPHCSGKDSMVEGQRVKNLLTTESLEFTI